MTELAMTELAMTELAIIGAGPAGMAAATTAAEAGLSVTLLDEQPRPGGQIYRDVERVAGMRGDILGPEYTAGVALANALQHPNITHVRGACVWAIEDQYTIYYTKDGVGGQLNAKKVVLATGALERAMPLPGWTLPGVMGAGAAQILLKQSGIIPRKAVLVGCGPLLYLVAAQMVRAGHPPLALVETQRQGDMISAMKHLPGALRGWKYLAKGMKLLSEIKRAGVPRYAAASDIAIKGNNKAEAISFTSKGKSHRIACDTVLLHHGVVPNTQMARSLEIEHQWSDAQQCFVPVVDEWGMTNSEGLYIAGDSAGIGGAIVAEHAGRLAALKIAGELGRLTFDECKNLAAPHFQELKNNLAIRPFLDAAYPPFDEALSPADTTLVCRCEEVTAGDIRKYAKQGCLGPNQAKAFGRAGMGPCQGRYCGLTVSALLAQANDQTPQQTGYYRIRAPIKPVTLGELAAIDDAQQEIEKHPDEHDQASG